MFDRSLLPPADLEFVLIADTHQTLPSNEIEFASRSSQTDRVKYALKIIEQLNPDFVIHLGDTIQSFPTSDGFESALKAARKSLEKINLDVHVIPGNHDVGDKPDPTMPTESVTQKAIDTFENHFGQSWAHKKIEGIDFVSINSQLLNTSIPAALQQREWLEHTLLKKVEWPTFLFTHLPLFLFHPGETSVGHYDAIDEPARSWLINLIRKAPVNSVFSAHTHFEFRNCYDDVNYYLVPSPSFTRPGFPEVFSSSSPPERGRADLSKLGFYLVRIKNNDPDMHFIRTGGRTEFPSDNPIMNFLSQPTDGGTSSHLGISSVKPLTSEGTVPGVFPSNIPYSVTNDYPLISLLRVGAHYFHLPIGYKPLKQSELMNLEFFRAKGGIVVGRLLCAAENITNPLDESLAATVDEIDLRLAGAKWPSEKVGGTVNSLRSCYDLPVNLSIALPDYINKHKQHRRTRTGYYTTEVKRLNDKLADLDIYVDRINCVPSDTHRVWKEIVYTPRTYTNIGAVDWTISSVNQSISDAVHQMCVASAAITTRSNSRLYLEPFRELDRTMDLAPGLLDRYHNPSPLFHATRILNSTLSSSANKWEPVLEQRDRYAEMIGLASERRSILLVLPYDSSKQISLGIPDQFNTKMDTTEIDLKTGVSSPVDKRTDKCKINDATLLIFD
jgi:hypothetical protein